MRTNVGPESVFITLLAIKLGLGRLRNLFYCSVMWLMQNIQTNES